MLYFIILYYYMNNAGGALAYILVKTVSIRRVGKAEHPIL